MTRATIFALGVAAIIGAAAAAAIHANWNAVVPIAAMGINYFRYLDAPKGELTVETAPGFDGANPAAAVRSAPPDDGLWPSYNKTLASDRFSSLNEINRENADRLKVLCTYDTHQYTGFNSGLLMVDGALLFATEHDTYSIDPITCREKWHKHESYAPATPQPVNRGVAYLDGRVFRGTQDGRVLAYDFKSGERLWETAIADPTKSESAPAAPIAWNDLVFIGNAGGDFKGVKGRMYALDAATGRIVWEFYLVPKQPGDPTRGPQGVSPLDTSSWDVAGGSPISGGATWTSYTLDPTTGLLYVPGGNPAPDFAATLRGGANLYTDSVVVLDAKTGAYHTHFKLMPKDWHDWDISTAPALVTTASGKRVMLVAPKDGHLYGFDLDTKERLYRVPVTAVENADVPFSAEKSVHFCPGSVGGAEWNGPAYDPQNNLVLVGEVQWCTTVRIEPTRKIEGAAKFTSLVRGGFHQSLQRVGQSRSRVPMGGLALRGRRRQRSMALAGQDQLSRAERRGADSGRPRLFWRHGRQFICARRGYRPRTLGRKDRRRDWRRGHYLHHAAGSTCRRRDRSHGNPLANRDNDSQGFDPGPRQELSALLVALPLLTRHVTGEGEQFTLHAPHSPRAAQN